ncbi:MAG: PqqD family protein [Gammaproteobacteria bacterium]
MRFARLRTADDVLIQTVVGEAVLLDLRSQKYFGLNEVGTRAWQLLQETGDAAAVYERLGREYDVDAAQLERDLDELFDRLLKAGLVEEPRGEKA